MRYDDNQILNLCKKLASSIIWWLMPWSLQSLNRRFTMTGDPRVELFYPYGTRGLKVTRYGYRTAQPTDKFLRISGRSDPDKWGTAIRNFQEELDILAGHEGMRDNHCTYLITNEENREEFSVLFHDDDVLFGRGVLVQAW